MEGESNPFPLFGREEIFERLEKRLEALKKGYRQNLGLVGPRHIGKTLLLTRFLGEARKDPEIISIYVSLEGADFESFSERWLGGLLQGYLITQGIPFPDEFQTLVKISRTFIPKTLDGMREAKKHAFHKRMSLALRELLALTGTLREETGKKILLILDEFQGLGDLEVTDPFGLFGKEMMVQKDTLYLATSSEPHKTAEIFGERLSLLFGNFEVIPMNGLKLEALRMCASAKYPEIQIPEADWHILSHLLGSSPYYFDLFFEGIRTLGLRKRSLEWSRERMREAAEETLFSDRGPLHRHFEAQLQTLLSLSRSRRPYLKTLLALANGRVKVLPIAAYLGKKTSEAHKLLQRLVEEGRVEKSGSFYRLPDPLFRFWLRNVFQTKDRDLDPAKSGARSHFQNRWEEEVRKIEEEDRMDLTERVSSLFREFRNDIVEVDRKRMKCPAFLEIGTRPTNGRYFPILGRTSQGSWFCQVTRETLTEADVAGFAEELKRFRRNTQRRIVVALGGVDLNAKLMAQEAKIQIWDLDNFNALLDLYGKLKVIA